MKKAAVLFCALFLVICVLAVFSAAAEDEVRSERTVLVDEEGILLVAEESTVKTGRRNSPYIQFTLQNNTDQELFIALNGTVNGYNTRIGLSPQDSTQSLESIRPGETLSGDLIFTSQYDEYMGGTNVSEFTVASFFGRMDEIDRKTGYPKLYYESGPVTIPCSGDYTPPESWIPFCENDMFRLTAYTGDAAGSVHDLADGKQNRRGCGPGLYGSRGERHPGGKRHAQNQRFLFLYARTPRLQRRKAGQLGAAGN